MEYLPINDLPNELLELIFDHLEVDELKDASLVCKRWSDLAFIGRRMDRVTLVQSYLWDKDLLQSNRKHRHLQLWETSKDFAYVKELLQTFSVTSLRIRDFDLTHSSLRSILLEVPNLQHLSIVLEPKKTNKMMEPFPVMEKLERLEISNGNWNSTLPWHTIAPSLQDLKINCISEDQLEQWSLLSGQLKHVYARFHEENSFNRFCQMTFPFLEELSIKLELSFDGCEQDLFERLKFIRRNPSLRRLRLHGIYLTKTLVQDITNHNKKLTSLEIIGDYEYESEHNGAPESLESLSQLPELKHLRLKNMDTSIFRGCEALTSLQSLSINLIKFNHEGSLGFLQDVYKIAPQLRCLELWSFKISERALYFICNNFSKLTRLQLTVSEVVSRDCLSGINRLPHLWCLELNLSYTKTLFIRNIPQNNVRYLTLHLPAEYNGDDLFRLPEIFFQLDRLNLISGGKCLHESTVDRLRKLLPTCAVKLCGYLVTNAGMLTYGRMWQRGDIMPVWEKEWVWNNPNEWEWNNPNEWE